jgi:DedD protein
VPASASLAPHEQIVNLPPPAEVKPAEQPAVAVKPEKPADKPVDKPQDKQTAKAEQKHEDKDEARAQAILEGKDVNAKPAAKSVDKEGGKFVVQVAALTSKDKITELQGKLSDAGFKPMLQTVPTDAGPTTRVRVGPFASKEEAETARAKLAKLGLSGKLLPL